MTGFKTHQMEVKKDGLRQMQDGTWKLSLTVHPNDMPTDLMQAEMGKIYMAVLAPVQDNGEPEHEKERKPFDSLPRAQQAGMLCQDARFVRWLKDKRPDADPSRTIEQHVRDYCGVPSRSDLDKDHRAANAWDKIVATYRRETGQLAEQRG